METIERVANNNGVPIQIATSLAGSSPRLLVFSHGPGCSRRGFDGVIKTPWILDNFTVFTLDLPGFGESDKPDAFSYELEELAQIVSRLITEHDAPEVAIVGHRLGGVVGLFAAQHSDASLFSLAA